MPNDYLEIKRHINKPDQQFHCELLHRETAYAVLRYVADTPGLIADIHIPPGSTTIAHYWQQRPYVVWRMFDRTHCLIGTLFHICTNVCIHKDHLSYADLLIDIWIEPDGKVSVLDENELKSCTEAGFISEEIKNLIHDALQDVLTHHKDIIAELRLFDCSP